MVPALPLQALFDQNLPREFTHICANSAKKFSSQACVITVGYLFPWKNFGPQVIMKIILKNGADPIKNHVEKGKNWWTLKKLDLNLEIQAAVRRAQRENSAGSLKSSKCGQEQPPGQFN